MGDDGEGQASNMKCKEVDWLRMGQKEEEEEEEEATLSDCERRTPVTHHPELGQVREYDPVSKHIMKAQSR